MDIIWKFHNWYDKLKKPYRFLIFMSFIIPYAIFGNMNNRYGMVAIIIMLWVLIPRIIWVEWKGKEWKRQNK